MDCFLYICIRFSSICIRQKWKSSELNASSPFGFDYYYYCHLMKRDYNFLLFFSHLFSDADAENRDALLDESQANPLSEDSPTSESAAIEEQSPTSDVDESATQIKSQVPRIDAINKKQLNSTIDKRRHHLNQRQLPAIDVEHNIPVSFIHDTNNVVNVERYVPYFNYYHQIDDILFSERK